MTKLKLSLFVSIVLVGLGLTGAKVDAANITASLKQPDEQLNTSVAYLDIPGEKDQVISWEVVVTNKEDREVDVEATVTNANSSNNGVIEYGSVKKDSQSSKAPFDLTKIITSDVKENALELAAGEEQTIHYSATVPKDFKGVIGGGLNFKEKADPKATGVVNVTQRTIAMFLHGKEPELGKVVEMPKVELAIDNAKTALLMDVDNQNGLFIKDFDFSAEIKDKSGKVTVKSTKLKEDELFSVAPYSLSHLKLPLDLSSAKKLRAGEYPVTITLKTEKNDWTFDKTITVKEEVSNKLIEEVKEVNKKTFPWPWVVVGVMLVVILILVIYIIKSNKKEIKKG